MPANACDSVLLALVNCEPLTRTIWPALPELDIEIVRELAGGMYFGERGNTVENGVERAFDGLALDV